MRLNFRAGAEIFGEIRAVFFGPCDGLGEGLPEERSDRA
nr:MAG TPA: hypothetical protein [Caudoviricetes sp.]